MNQSFTAWLQAQSYRNDLVGDFAETATDEEGWPQTEDKLALEVYLHYRGATPNGIRAFHLAYEEWLKSRHLPSINMWMKPQKPS